MIKDKVSVVIPARNEKYLKQTIQDLLQKAKGDIEIVAILDGYWPEESEMVEDSRVMYLHFSEARGIRNAINSGVRMAQGEFVMKIDAHCMMADGFDTVLKADCKDNWIVVPRRYPLDPEKWAIQERTDSKYPIDYMILDENLQGIPTKGDKAEDVDILMTSQGSCWFMKKTYFEELELLDEATYGTFWQEFQEIGLKCWLSGGQVMINKKTWYAHWHKTESRGYTLPRDEQDKTRAVVKKWKEMKMFHKQIHDLDWLFAKFNINGK